MWSDSIFMQIAPSACSELFSILLNYQVKLG